MATYKEILLEKRHKREIIDIGRCFGVILNPKETKDTCASLVEQALLNNPLIIRNFFSYKEILALEIVFEHTDRRGIYPPNLDAAFYTCLHNIKSEIIVLDGIEIKRDQLYYPSNVRDSICSVFDQLIGDKEYIRQYEIENLLLAFITLYGILPFNKMQELLNEQRKEELSIEEITKSATQSHRAVSNIRIAFYKEKTYFHHISIKNPQEFIKEFESRSTLNYFVFSDEEISDAFYPLYFYINKYIVDIGELFKKNNIVYMDKLFQEMWINLQIDNTPKGAIDLISSNLKFEGLAEFQKTIDALVKYSNSMPRWILKGNSSNSVY